MSTALLPFTWPDIGADLDASGCATVGPLLSPAACDELARCYDRSEGFRSRVVMGRHGFGQAASTKYFGYPLPEPVQALRRARLPRLGTGRERLGRRGWDCRPTAPPTLDEQLARCHAAGQTRPTPLLLRYGPGDYNCLHQDLYGPLHFPLQLAILLNEPGRDFEGGEFVLVEQRPRMQSRPGGGAAAPGPRAWCSRPTIVRCAARAAITG